jgi:hypothetical protein
VILLVVAACGLAACGDFYWRKQGASQADFDRESNECQQQSAPGQWESCMKGRGWTYASGW